MLPETQADTAAKDIASRFRLALAGFHPGAPVMILGHNDADGLAAVAILRRAFDLTARETRVRIVGRGESPWSAAMRAELAAGGPAGGLVVVDLGVRGGAILPGTPTVIIDHHVPTGAPADATVITGYGSDPVPTSSLLAFRCAAALAPSGEAHAALLWLAALGIIGDMAEGAGFAEMAAARRRWGIGALREAVVLVNAPRRSSSGDAGPALALLLAADGPREVTSGEHAETALLRAARDEVRAELERARRVAPIVRGSVALIRFASPCQIHPLIAQQWRGRLKNLVVLAANTGYRAGWVHFAARTSRDVDLIDFLARHAPPGADEQYGSGHRAATGGAVRPRDWNAFAAGLGFGPEAEVPHTEAETAQAPEAGAAPRGSGAPVAEGVAA